MFPGSVDHSALIPTAFKPGRPAAKGRLVVVSNRVADLSAGHQSGGLAVAVGEALTASGGIWFGWSGEVGPDAHARPPQVRRSGDVRTVTVALTPEEHQGYYLGFANNCLWPLFHYRLDLADLRSGSEAAYFEVNKRFAAGGRAAAGAGRHHLGARLSADPVRRLSPPARGDESDRLLPPHPVPLARDLRRTPPPQAPRPHVLRL
jgi:hypothetical protein